MKIKKNISDFVNLKLRDLKRDRVSHISLNIGILCNQECMHCHLEAGPDKKDDVMGREMIDKLKDFINYIGPDSLDITGGAPELNKSIIELIDGIRPLVKKISLRTNLTAMLDCDFSKLSTFLYDRRISLVASLPCYSKDRVNSQRGDGVFKKSVAVLRRLNSVGFGVDNDVSITLAYNPTDFSLPSLQQGVQGDFKKKLAEAYGIIFTDLIAITNVPIGRFADQLKKVGHFEDYIQNLKNNYNQKNLSGLMCLNQITIDWKGRFYDCDFNLALDLPAGGWSDLDSFKENSAIGRKIYTGYHCLACTAGSGSSCHGSLS